MNYGRLLAILILTLPLTMVAEAATATITGYVSSAGEGTPLEGMTVAVYPPAGSEKPQFSTVTSGDGIYQIAVPAGSYKVVAWDPSLEFATSFYDEAPNFEASQIITVSGSSSFFADFRLVRNGRITGTVSAAETRRPLRSMTVAAYDSQGFRRATSVSDASGTYILALPPGNYRIAAWDDSLEYLYAAQFYPATFMYDSAQPVSVTAQNTVKGIDFALPKSASISGIVTDRSTGAPLKNMVVEAWIGGHRAQQATTDSSGRYLLRVPPTSLKVLSWDPSGAYATVFDGNASSFDRISPRSPAPGATLTNVDLSMVRGGRIAGGVVSASNGAVLQEMTVAAFNSDGTLRSSTTTAADGSYSFLLPPGAYSIAAWDADLRYLSRFYPSTQKFDDSSPVTVSSGLVQTGIDILLPRAGRIVGRVTSSSTATSLKGIEIILYDLQGRRIATAVTKMDGRFIVAAEPGTYRLIVADPQRIYATWYYDGAKTFETSATVTAVAGNDFEIAAALTVAARVDGNVRDRSTGTAIEGVRVAAFDLEGETIATARTDSNGAFSLLVPPGSYRIAAGDTARRYDPSWYDGSSTFSEAKTIFLGSGIVRPIDFVLDPQDSSRHRSVRRR